MLVLGQLLRPCLALHAARPVPGVGSRCELVTSQHEGRPPAVGRELLAGPSPPATPRAAGEEGGLFVGCREQRAQDRETGRDDAGCDVDLGPARGRCESVGCVGGAVGGEKEDIAIGGGEDDTGWVGRSCQW